MASKGRKPRGERTATSLLLPTDHLNQCRKAAAELRMSVGDYIALKLAAAHGWPEPEYIAEEEQRIRRRDEIVAWREKEQREQEPPAALFDQDQGATQAA